MTEILIAIHNNEGTRHIRVKPPFEIYIKNMKIYDTRENNAHE